MKQRQCRDVSHAPSIFEPVIDSYGGGNAKPRTIVRGFRTYLSGIGDLLLTLLLLTRLLLAALLLLATLTRLRLAALLLLTRFLLAALLATLLLLAGLLVWILIHRSFLSNIGSPLRSLVFHGKS
jgi:hypothetical protein